MTFVPPTCHSFNAFFRPAHHIRTNQLDLHCTIAWADRAVWLTTNVSNSTIYPMYPNFLMKPPSKKWLVTYIIYLYYIYIYTHIYNYIYIYILSNINVPMMCPMMYAIIVAPRSNVKSRWMRQKGRNRRARPRPWFASSLSKASDGVVKRSAAKWWKLPQKWWTNSGKWWEKARNSWVSSKNLRNI